MNPRASRIVMFWAESFAGPVSECGSHLWMERKACQACAYICEVLELYRPIRLHSLPFHVSELLFKFMQAIAIYNGEIYNSRQVPSCVFIRAALWDYGLSRYLPDLVSDTNIDQMVSRSLKDQCKHCKHSMLAMC